MKSVWRIPIASALALLLVSFLLIGLHKNGQAANSPAVQKWEIALTTIEDTSAESYSNTRSLNIVGGNVYLFTDFSNSSYRVFSTTAKTWTVDHSSTVITQMLEGYASGVLSDTIYVLGGVNVSHTYQGDVWKFSPISNTWSRGDSEATTPILGGRAGGSFTGAPSRGELLAFGGSPPFTPAGDEVWRYNPATTLWTTSNMPNPDGDRPGHSAGVIGDRLYLVGGVTPPSGNFVQAVTLDGSMFPSVYITGTQSPTPRTYPATVFDSQNNRIYVFGGKSITSSAAMTDTWYLSLGTGIWNRLPDLPQPLTNTHAAGWYNTAFKSTVNSEDFFVPIEILLVGDQINNGTTISYVYDEYQMDYEQIAIPADFSIYLPFIIRNYGGAARYYRID
ncbi:MAG: hypothetical protein GYA34_16210 [Chloroflexi bacterium]|nr:hypothetical protein [Chloroflexota bacterium]